MDHIGAKAGQDIGRRMAIEVGSAGDDAGRKWATGFERRAEQANPTIDVRTAGQSAGEDAGDSFMGGFGSSLAGLGLRGGPVVAALGSAALLIGKTLGPMVADSMQQQMAADLVQARLGPDPTMMARSPTRPARRMRTTSVTASLPT